MLYGTRIEYNALTDGARGKPMTRALFFRSGLLAGTFAAVACAAPGGELGDTHEVSETGQALAAFTTQACSDEQIANLGDSPQMAAVYAQRAYASYVLDPESANAMYWFGTASEETVATVTTVLDGVVRRMNAQPMTYRCDCPDPSSLAYVYSWQPGTINLCKLFWKARETGQLSKAGTIVHEYTHFEGTDDDSADTYMGDGPIEARNLAISNPDATHHTAINYQMFVEHTPID
jgi:hypothetical protein